MLTKSGAKLLDFGIAALRRDLRDAEMSGDTAPTAPGQVFGTLRYMAQNNSMAGRPMREPTSSACGLVLYEMATGHKAVERRGNHRDRDGDPDRIAASICEVLAECPADLDWAIRRCLARDPAERWQSAADLSAVLRWMSGPARRAIGHARPVVATSRSWTQWRRAGRGAGARHRVGRLFAWRWRGVRCSTGSDDSARPFPRDRWHSRCRRTAGGGTVSRRPASGLRGRGQFHDQPLPSCAGSTRLHAALPGTEGAAAPFFSADGNSLDSSPDES